MNTDNPQDSVRHLIASNAMMARHILVLITAIRRMELAMLKEMQATGLGARWFEIQAAERTIDMVIDEWTAFQERQE